FGGPGSVEPREAVALHRAPGATARDRTRDRAVPAHLHRSRPDCEPAAAGIDPAAVRGARSRGRAADRQAGTDRMGPAVRTRLGAADRHSVAAQVAVTPSGSFGITIQQIT